MLLLRKRTRRLSSGGALAVPITGFGWTHSCYSSSSPGKAETATLATAAPAPATNIPIATGMPSGPATVETVEAALRQYSAAAPVESWAF
uniref:Putative secreted protein synganglion overexpressed n=1 Tax=Rhipicephalus microplus TaxID=6941 RepID=A0A6M2DAB1_RHIMP